MANTTRSDRWFEVDRHGLEKLLDRVGRARVVTELVQNAWEAPDARNVRVTINKMTASEAEIIVKDDSPEGFADLSHAFTLFAESGKKGDPTKRGRFNLGEKLVLAACREAVIVTRKGTVAFNPDSTRSVVRSSTSALKKIGTTFRGIIRLTRADVAEVSRMMRTLIPPINTTYNGELIPVRVPLASQACSLVTEVADEMGVMRRVKRDTTIELYETAPDEIAMLYEMGIPVCETNDRWHVNVKQRVPLNIERDGVTPAYLKSVRAIVVGLAATNNLLDRESATAPWVDDGMSSAQFDASVSAAVVAARFGQKAVIYDPSDPEANKRAVSAGYTVIPGGSFSGPAWAAVKAGGGVLPAGQVTPSPKPYSAEGKPLQSIPESEWSNRVRTVVAFYKSMARAVLGKVISVDVVDAKDWPFAATYGPSSGLRLNLAGVDKGIMQWGEDQSAVIDLGIHEFGHEFEGDHLSTKYYSALTRVGALTAQWLADESMQLDTIRVERAISE